MKTFLTNKNYLISVSTLLALLMTGCGYPGCEQFTKDVSGVAAEQSAQFNFSSLPDEGGSRTSTSILDSYPGPSFSSEVNLWRKLSDGCENVTIVRVSYPTLTQKFRDLKKNLGQITEADLNDINHTDAHVSIIYRSTKYDASFNQVNCSPSYSFEMDVPLEILSVTPGENVDWREGKKRPSLASAPGIEVKVVVHANDGGFGTIDLTSTTKFSPALITEHHSEGDCS